MWKLHKLFHHEFQFFTTVFYRSISKIRFLITEFFCCQFTENFYFRNWEFSAPYTNILAPYYSFWTKTCFFWDFSWIFWKKKISAPYIPEYFFLTTFHRFQPLIVVSELNFFLQIFPELKKKISAPCIPDYWISSPLS